MRRNFSPRRSVLSALTLTVLASGLAVIPLASPVHAFGTLHGVGNVEHQSITRAALACAEGVVSDGNCFEPKTIDRLAGTNGFGAVGSPDRDEIPVQSAHCDGADFLDVPDYPRTRQKASDKLRACVEHLQKRFQQGLKATFDIADPEGLNGNETDLNRSCTFTFDFRQSAKCRTLEGFGRALHGIQDFYSHSNWVDQADPSREISIKNPPGLNRSAPSPILDLLRGNPLADNEIPYELSTGCFSLRPRGCHGRIDHAHLNKDTGKIDPVTGETRKPQTSRGEIADNFQRAVAGAIIETRKQWADFQSALRAIHGDQQAAVIICAITHDRPMRTCQ